MSENYSKGKEDLQLMLCENISYWAQKTSTMLKNSQILVIKYSVKKLSQTLDKLYTEKIKKI